jgi:hypothetical protein
MAIWAFPRTDSNGQSLNPPWVVAEGDTQSAAKASAQDVSGQSSTLQDGHKVPDKAAKKWEPLLDGANGPLLVAEDDLKGHSIVEEAS